MPNKVTWLENEENITTSDIYGTLISRKGLHTERCELVVTSKRVCCCAGEKSLRDFMGVFTVSECVFYKKEMIIIIHGKNRVMAMRLEPQTDTSIIMSLRIGDVSFNEREASFLLPEERRMVPPTERRALLYLLEAEATKNNSVKDKPSPPPGRSILIDKKTFVIEGGIDSLVIDPPNLEKVNFETEYKISIISIEGKGRGLVNNSATTIPRGTLLWTEEPMEKWIQGSEDELGVALCQNEENFKWVGFLQSHGRTHSTADESSSAPPREFYDRLNEVLEVNAWDFSNEEDHTHRGIFQFGSLLNHSCGPNVRYDIREGRSFAIFRAIRDIVPGEELTVAYTHSYSAVIRRQELAPQKRFECKCVVCSSEDKSRLISCPDSSCCGFVAPKAKICGKPHLECLWTCKLCKQTFQENNNNEPSVDVIKESWICRLVATCCDHADQFDGIHFIAVLLFAARSLGPKHWTLAAVCEAVLLQSKTLSKQLPYEGLVAVCRYLLNWCQFVNTDIIIHRSNISQALYNTVNSVQDMGGPATYLIITLAAFLYPLFLTILGPDDFETCGMRTIMSLQTLNVNSLLGFSWLDFEEEFSPLSEGDLMAQVKEKLTKIEEGYQTKADPYNI